MVRNCVFFVNTGSCSFGIYCRYFHPTEENAQEGNNGNASGGKPVKPSRSIPCKFYRVGNCKKGSYCKFAHNMQDVLPEYRQLNFLGLPYRPGAQDCSFYLRNGCCGYGLACKFHHPNPPYYNNETYEHYEVGNGFEYPHAPMTDNSVKATMPWNENQQVSGNFNRPTYRPARVSSLVLNEAGLPQRPGKAVCRHYERTGECIYSRACAFDHPPTVSSDVDEGSTSTSAPGVKTPETEE